MNIEPTADTSDDRQEPEATSQPDDSDNGQHPEGRADEPAGEGSDTTKKKKRRRRRRRKTDDADASGDGHEPSADAPPERARGTPPEMDGRVFDAEIFVKDTTFAELGLPADVLDAITEAGFVHPTSIQAMLIPPILDGKDVLGQAKTGTGKTAAFALPILSRIEKGDPFAALVLVPTRELAIQVAADFKELGKYTGIKALPVYGGQNINTQADKLAKRPEVIIATPGRLMDMVRRRAMHLKNVKMACLDEVDRMLDIGFRDDIKQILSQCPQDRQTVFVSATMQPEIEKLARTHSNNAEKIIATAGALTVSMVKQFYLTVEDWDKRRLLRHLLTHEDPALTVVFCRMKRTVDKLVEYLAGKGIEAHAIHGDMYQAKRNRVIEKLRKGSLSVLIASDLASRGLDVEGITHVINYDLPDDPDLYVHRIGRTARAGRDGVAWSLVTPEQGGLLTQIELLINAEIPKLDYPDFKPGPVPEKVEQQRRSEQDRREKLKQTATRHAAPLPTPAKVEDPGKFPGGLVPTKMPPKRMGGKMRTRRG